MTDDLSREIARLMTFLDNAPLTLAIRDLEQELDGSNAETAARVIAGAGIDHELLAAAVVTRQHLGRINDLIHASAISLILPTILDSDEVVLGRPSLAAGNDPSRPFDLQTNKRVAEFKLARWAGADAMRKRGVFQDLVHLAADTSGRRAQLFVVGQAPIMFLRGSTSTAQWGLDRATTLRATFEQRFGPLTMPIRQFTEGPGGLVELVDLLPLLPALEHHFAAG
ncbi:hypothetical protein [Microlunatus ginsengisoli]|uniref:PE-PGRS family protein n=1 Tax=Microlunatus ginsengisoli TaxID=363863 RepID=A0ABP6ZCQ3_9ACTN